MACSLATVGACATPGVPRSSARPRERELVATHVAAAPRVTVATPLTGPPWRVDDTRIVWGGVRFEVRDAEVEAAGGLGGRIVAVTHSERGWLFLTADGVLARAGDFLGGLELVERWDGTGSLVAARDRIVIAQRDVLWTSAGDELARHSLPAPLEDGAFLGDTGLALAGGALHETRDGGRTWSPIDLGGVLPLAVSLADDGFAVMRTDGPHRWRDGGWERVSSAPTETAILTSSQRLPLLRAAARLPWMRLDAELLAELEEQARNLEEGCVDAAFGGAYSFARCARDGAAWWERRGGAELVRVDVASSDPPLVSTDGRTALWMTPCGAREDGACALVGDRATSAPLDADADVVAVGAGLAVVRRDDAEPWERALLVDLRTGRPVLVRFSSEARAMLDAPTVQLEGAWIASDGRSLTLSLRRESAHSRQLVLATGDPAAGLRVHPLPLGAAQVGTLAGGAVVVFGDSARGHHWGRSGGRFRRLQIPLDGALGSEADDVLTCSETSCRSGSIVIGTDTQAESALLGGGGWVQPTLTPRVRVIQLDEVREWPRLECDGATWTPLTAAGSVVSTQPRARARREVDGAIERWSWRTGSGPEQYATAPAPASAPESVTLMHATPQYALVARCVARACAVDMLREGRVEAIPAPPLLAGWATLPLDDGGAIVVVRVSAPNREYPINIGWRFDATGRLARSIARPAPLYLARWGSYGWLEPAGDELIFTGLDGSVRRFGHHSEHEPRPCRDAPRRDALLVRHTTQSWLDRDGRHLSAFPWLELEPASACVRAYEVHPATPMEVWPSRIEAHAGRLRVIERGRPSGECREHH